MRTSAMLKVAGAVLAFGSLLFVIPSQAGAESGVAAGGDDLSGSESMGWAAYVAFYHAHGYAYGHDAPDPGAKLFHVKIRKGHKHTIKLIAGGPDNTLIANTTLKTTGGYNAWYDPSRVSGVVIVLSGRSTIGDRVDGNHCYYEDKKGNLQRATDRPCNAN